MDVTVDTAGRNRFSKTALLARGSRPGHRPARRHAQCRPTARESRAVCARRLTNDIPERATEGAKAVEADVEADLGHGTIRLSQQLHRPLDAAALEVTVRRLAERVTELAAEMGGRDVGDPRQR